MFLGWLINKIKRNQKGFTLVELILSMIVAGSIFAIVAESMHQQAQTYSFIANRKATIADVRRTLSDMTYELLHITSNDIIAITSSSISFVDSKGTNSSYKLDTSGDGLAIYRGNDDVILPGVADFEVEYQDGEGNDLDAIEDNIENVVRIKLTISTETTDAEDSITISTTIIPRSFIGYSNYN